MIFVFQLLRRVKKSSCRSSALVPSRCSTAWFREEKMRNITQCLNTRKLNSIGNNARRLSNCLSSNITRLLLALAVGLCAAVAAAAQSDNAQISGFVKDPSGATISGAKVVVKSQSRSTERNAVTNDQGYYVISNLPPDIY